MSNIRGGHKRLIYREPPPQYKYPAFGFDYKNRRDLLTIDKVVSNKVYNYQSKLWYLYLGTYLRETNIPYRTPTLIVNEYDESFVGYYIKATQELGDENVLGVSIPASDETLVASVSSTDGVVSLLGGGFPGGITGSDINAFYYVVSTETRYKIYRTVGSVSGGYSTPSIYFDCGTGRSIYYSGTTYTSRYRLSLPQYAIRNDDLVGSNPGLIDKLKHVGFATNKSDATTCIFSVVEEIEIGDNWYPIEIKTYKSIKGASVYSTTVPVDISSSLPTSFSNVTWDGSKWVCSSILAIYGIAWAISSSGNEAVGIYTNLSTYDYSSASVVNTKAIISTNELQSFSESTVSTVGDEDFYYLADTLIDKPGNIVLGRGYNNPYKSYASVAAYPKHYYGALYNIRTTVTSLLSTGSEIEIQPILHMHDGDKYLDVICDYALTDDGHVFVAGAYKWRNFFNNIEFTSSLYLINYTTYEVIRHTGDNDDIFSEGHCCVDITH